MFWKNGVIKAGFTLPSLLSSVKIFPANDFYTSLSSKSLSYPHLGQTQRLTFLTFSNPLVSLILNIHMYSWPHLGHFICLVFSPVYSLFYKMFSQGVDTSFYGTISGKSKILCFHLIFVWIFHKLDKTSFISLQVFLLHTHLTTALSTWIMEYQYHLILVSAF